MMKDMNIQVEDFLRPFFEPGEMVALRIFSDKKGSPYRGQKLECQQGKIESVIPTLRVHNAQDRGIFFVVNYGGHEDRDITRINAHFVECDTKSLEEQLKALDAFPLPPSIIVRTRKSLHAYWLMKKAEVSRFRAVQRRLINRFDGDGACINESRVLRLPGFEHRKEEPVMVSCIRFNPELRYTQEELCKALPEPEEKPPSAGCSTKTGSRRGLNLVLRKCEFIKHCRAHAAELSEHDWYAMITNLGVFEGGRELIHELSKPYLAYSYDETEKKLMHFMDSDTGPITCKTIASKGFKCPLFIDGSCPAKAPAALCYKPLDAADLRFLLSEVEVKNTAVEDMQSARAFTAEYLYNIEPLIAGTFINYELKAYFGFKSGTVKPLEAYQRELYKNYRESKDTKREIAMGGELPNWYEPTEKGGLKFLPGILANYMAKNVSAFYGAESYYIYEDGVYKEATDLVASGRVREFLIHRFTTLSGICDAEGQWRMLIYKPVREINPNPFVINVKNGLYNVAEDSFKPHTPEYYSTVQINAAYDRAAKCPGFLEFLAGILGPEEIKLVQEMLGYLLIPVNKAQKSFVFVGAPNAGKSTLLSIAQEILLGSSNVSNVPWQSLSDRFKTAELFGKLANIFADLPSKSIDDNGIFKALTGEDYITAERKNKNPFSFRPHARLLFSCNEIPKNYGDRSDGFFRRLIIIRFDRSIPQDKRDANLRDKLSKEGDGILMWALLGLKRLIQNGYVFSETASTREELQRYRIENNSVLSFADECCRIEDSVECSRDELFSRYREYCNNAGFKSVSQISFNKEIEGIDQSIRRGHDKLGRRRIWRGIKFTDSAMQS